MLKQFSRQSPKEILDYFGRLDRKSRLRLLSLIGGTVLFFFLIFCPAWFVRPHLQTQIRQFRNQIHLAQSRISQEPKLLEEKREHEAFVKDAQSRLFDEREGDRLVGILARMAEESQVALLSTEPQGREEAGNGKFPPPFDKKYRGFSYLITVEANYHQLATFVSQIENYSKILRITELSIVPKEETPKIHLGQILVSAFATQGGKKEGV